MSENAYGLTGVLALCRGGTSLYTQGESRDEAAMQTQSQVEILRRLSSAEGHLKGVIEMVEAGRPCGLVLQQLSAVQSILRLTSVSIIRSQVQESGAIISDGSSAAQRVDAMRMIQLLFRIFTKQAHPSREVLHE